MVCNNGHSLKIGDSVEHRFREWGHGVITRIDGGCNAVAWADFGGRQSVIITRLDVTKVITV